MAPGAPLAAVGQRDESRPDVHALELRPGHGVHVSDISPAEIDQRYAAHLAYLKATRTADSLVSGSTKSTLAQSYAAPKWLRLR